MSEEKARIPERAEQMELERRWFFFCRYDLWIFLPLTRKIFCIKTGAGTGEMDGSQNMYLLDLHCRAGVKEECDMWRSVAFITLTKST